jgi:hypothetical protein
MCVRAPFNSIVLMEMRENEVVVRYSRIATWDVCGGCDIGGKK